MYLICLDLEGVFTPEIWINIALKTGIEELKITTRDEPNYEKLMDKRIKILKEKGITLTQIQEIIKNMDLLPGAKEFIDWLRENTQFIIVSDSFIEFTKPLMKKLGYPTIFCHELIINEDNFIVGYELRLRDMKENTIIAMKKLNFKVIAIGDSYNDIGMLKQADLGILFNPPLNVVEDYPQFQVLNHYDQLKQIISNYLRLHEEELAYYNIK